MSESAYSLFTRGAALLAGGHPHAAIVVLEQARDLEPRKGSIRELLGRAYFATGRFRDSEAEFSSAVDIEATNDYAHFGLALCLERRGRTVQARAHVKLAVAMRPESDDYRKALARISLAS